MSTDKQMLTEIINRAIDVGWDINGYYDDEEITPFKIDDCNCLIVDYIPFDLMTGMELSESQEKIYEMSQMSLDDVLFSELSEFCLYYFGDNFREHRCKLASLDTETERIKYVFNSWEKRQR